MSPAIRNILAVIVGALIGSAVNMGIIIIGSSVVPPPAGVDVTNMESLVAAMHLFEPKHFIMPFLAHAVGTLVGAYIAALISGNNKMTVAMIVGVLFLIGGVANCFMLPAPIWFIILDILVAYIPMSYIGGKLGGGRK